MKNIVTNQKLEDYRGENTQLITMPDGTQREVRMTPAHWEATEFLQMIELITPTDIAGFALEEVALIPSLGFDRAFRGVVAHLANRWE